MQKEDDRRVRNYFGWWQFKTKRRSCHKKLMHWMLTCVQFDCMQCTEGFQSSSYQHPYMSYIPAYSLRINLISVQCYLHIFGADFLQSSVSCTLLAEDKLGHTIPYSKAWDVEIWRFMGEMGSYNAVGQHSSTPHQRICYPASSHPGSIQNISSHK